jgi:ribosomal protein L16/L10AE
MSWEDIIKDYYLESAREQLNRHLILHGEMFAKAYPPLPWWKRKRNKIVYWWWNNVSWRFARRRPEYDYDD